MRSLTNKEEVHIKIFKKTDLWRFEIEYGNYKIAGNGLDFNDAELNAYKALTGLPEHGTIHLHYLDGKKVLPKKEK